MEFERSVFRLHQRCLQTKGCRICLIILMGVFAALTYFSLTNTVLMHALFINKSDILSSQITQQLIVTNQNSISQLQSQMAMLLKINDTINQIEIGINSTFDSNSFNRSIQNSQQNIASQNQFKLKYSNRTGQFLYDSSPYIQSNDELYRIFNNSNLQLFQNISTQYLKAYKTQNLSSQIFDATAYLNFLRNFNSSLLILPQNQQNFMRDFSDQRQRLKNLIQSINNTLNEENVGFRKEDLYKIMIFKSENNSNYLAQVQQYSTDRYSYLNYFQSKFQISTLNIQDSNQYIKRDILQTFQFSSDQSTYNLMYNSIDSDNIDLIENQTALQKRNINEHYIFLSVDQLFKNHNYLSQLAKYQYIKFVDISVPIINQIMFTFYRQEIYLTEGQKHEQWHWDIFLFKSRNRLIDYDFNDDIIEFCLGEIQFRVGFFIQQLFSFMLISILNAMILRIIVKCSVLFAYPMLWCMNVISVNRPQQIQRNIYERQIFYISLGAVGAQSAYLDRNRLSKSSIFIALFTCILVYYTAYISSFTLWTSISFSTVYSGQVNSQYFVYVGFMELLSLFCVRTRSSIKYLPKYLTILNMIFLTYLIQYPYPAQYESLTALCSVSILLFLFFIIKYEQSALLNWNPCGSYTPSENNPRCAYHLILLTPDYTLGFDLFSMFKPLHFQEFFPIECQEILRRINDENYRFGIDFNPVPNEIQEEEENRNSEVQQNLNGPPEPIQELQVNQQQEIPNAVIGAQNIQDENIQQSLDYQNQDEEAQSNIQSQTINQIGIQPQRFFKKSVNQILSESQNQQEIQQVESEQQFQNREREIEEQKNENLYFMQNDVQIENTPSTQKGLGFTGEKENLFSNQQINNFNKLQKQRNKVANLNFKGDFNSKVENIDDSDFNEETIQKNYK